ncbi:TetR/AcrR family transcriptional regulator [Piscicoccus intestinalis]|uniref:TetR/AcrR family transcriptional regulator n=1 Tax=Piscicoccus intestinalis TaxID=746033 RepID=UPI0008383CF1|nr:TetR/AcrR family transcriptional regulator [Piscicoccus intestinalis]
MPGAHDTREALRRTALAMFSQRGYDAVTVAQVARAANVSHMTFFRHFPSKESVVVADLFDPVIAAAVAAQPREWAPLRRAVQGLVAALDDEGARAELTSDEFRERVQLAASTPSLRGAVSAASLATEEAIAAALDVSLGGATGGGAGGGSADGATPGPGPLAARAAAAATMGAASAILLAWAAEGAGTDPAASLRDGLLSLLGEGS